MSNPNPSPSTRFGQPDGNPRNDGSWSKESTPRFKLEQMMKLSEQRLKEIADDNDAPYFERKIATAIKKGDWKVVREMIEQVYGQPKQTIDTTLVIPEPLAPVRDSDLEAN